jgi:oxygen-independent coproporphyrinogen-3 oxidase
MAFGAYVHIPYCLQKCHYCDFVTLDMNDSTGPAIYVAHIIKEIQLRSSSISARRLSSIYFGGGTPSVLDVDDILSILKEFANQGFIFESDIEITVEINPGTVTAQKLNEYLVAEVNRFSVGVQTFNEAYLKQTGRLHSVQESRDLLRLLRDQRVNYSFDLLFGLPHQNREDLAADLEELVSFDPPHVSLYNLTIPKQHFMNQNRASDEIQADMFGDIETALNSHGLLRYEISNFAKPGFESRHNSLYWTDQGYWGLGIGAHSYLPQESAFGVRFWNPASIATWQRQLSSPLDDSSQSRPFFLNLPERQVEFLKLNELLTDYCHTSLRMTRGLLTNDLNKKFDAKTASRVTERLDRLERRGLLARTSEGYAIAPEARPQANTIFLELTFTPEEIL